MLETVVIGVITLLIVAASTFYLYSRLVYSERKISLMENLLLDIKMAMEMEREVQHDTNDDDSSNIIEPVFETVEKDDTEYYTNVLTNTTTTDKVDASSPSEEVVTEEVAADVKYESLSREDLVALAEKKGLRVQKRLNKQQIINLVQDADKKSSELPGSESDGFVGGTKGSMEGSSLLSADLEDTTLESTQ
jgi:hypothetical protein